MNNAYFSSCEEAKEYIRNHIKFREGDGTIYIHTRDVLHVIQADMISSILSSLCQKFNLEIDYIGTADYPDLITIKLTQWKSPESHSINSYP